MLSSLFNMGSEVIYVESRLKSIFLPIPILIGATATFFAKLYNFSDAADCHHANEQRHDATR